MPWFLEKMVMERKAVIPSKIFSFLLLCIAVALLVSNVGAVSVDDAFITGYATAVLERELNVTAASLSVKDGVITVRSEKLKGADRDKVRTVLSRIPGVVRVEILESNLQVTPAVPTPTPPVVQATPEGEKIKKEVSPPLPAFLPQGRLFEPLIADPRWPHFSIAYQYYRDDKELKNVVAPSFGATLPLYRDKVPFGGQWQLGLQAAVFALFDLDSESWDLINADYWVGLPISYRKGAFSTLLRVFHQSSHLGDEFLLRGRVNRINLSYEGIDVKLSYDVGEWFRLYAGGGFLFDQEPSELDPWTVEAGLEFQGSRIYWGILKPIAGADFKSEQENDWDIDVSLRAGIQLESARTIGHQLQFMLEYFNGHSPYGQFFERKIEYIGIGAHFYY